MDLPPKLDSATRYVEDGPALGVTEEFDDLPGAEIDLRNWIEVRQPATSRTFGPGLPGEGR